MWTQTKEAKFITNEKLYVQFYDDVQCLHKIGRKINERVCVFVWRWLWGIVCTFAHCFVIYLEENYDKCPSVSNGDFCCWFAHRCSQKKNNNGNDDDEEEER